jgi:Trypsin-like peptidase domain
MSQDLHLTNDLDQLRSAILESVWPIVPRINGEWHPPGTGFLVSKLGLLLTARHVVEPPARARGRALNKETNKFYDEGQLFAFRLATTGPAQGVRNARIYHVDRITVAERGDLAVCQLRPSDVNRGPPLTSLAIRPGLPRLKEKVWTIGYDRVDVSVEEESEDTLHLKCETNANVTFGEIQEIFASGKHTVLAPFPCFEINAAIPGGMSGGPVINEQGVVCGMLSRSPSWEATATCSMLGLHMALRFDLLATENQPARQVLMYDLVAKGLIASDGSLANVRMVPEGDTFNVFVRP